MKRTVASRSLGPGTPIRYLLVLVGVLVVFLAIFGVLRLLPVAVLDDPVPLVSPDFVGAVLGVGLLIGDVALPVPSSLVMIAFGGLFGAVTGTLLSLLGSVGAAVVGYLLGRWVGPVLLARVCSDAERARADKFVHRWGVIAVAGSRPIPILAETVMVAAGASRLGVGKTVVAAALGAVPASVMFAVAGALGGGGPSGLLVFGAAIAASILLWLIGRRLRALG
jgi:uncharacterized membrane protein YdjX (TVP38/TMEM64 family)